MKILTETTPEAERVLADIYRRMLPAQKARVVQDAWRRARHLHAAGYRLRSPQADAREIFADWLQVTLGALPPSVTGNAMEEMTDLWKLVFDLVHVLDQLQIRYALGGSMASSIFGKPRFTEDADLSVEPFPGKEQTFAESLDASFYVSLDAVKQAVRERRSFNVIHTTSGFKIDVFISKESPFEQSAFLRRRQALLTNEPIYVLSPEDIILHKLEWFRLGGGVSDRQWGDILGVLQVQRDQLDFTYLEHWAKSLGLSDLLSHARQDAS
jgi:hypothetical protein